MSDSSQISQPLLINGTVLFLLSLLIGFAVPVLVSSRMGVAAHVAGYRAEWSDAINFWMRAKSSGLSSLDSIGAVGPLT